MALPFESVARRWLQEYRKKGNRRISSGAHCEKYIQNNDILRNNQLFLVTSEIMEKHFKEQCGIDDDKVIRAGYPRCVVNDNIQSYDHDIRKRKGCLPIPSWQYTALLTAIIMVLIS